MLTDLHDLRPIMRWIIALFYSAAGVAHVLAPDTLIRITPDWVPFPYAVIVATGIFEFAASIALVTKPLRKAAGIAMALYALCVWPANFKHAFEGVQIAHMPDSWFYHAPRLLLQPVIIWWALYAAEVIDWPWRRDTK